MCRSASRVRVCGGHRLAAWMSVCAVLLLNPADALLAAGPDAGTDDRAALRLSAGASWQTRNTVQIPNSAQGSRFSLRNAVGSGPVAYTRAELRWRFGARHGVRVVLAPLSYTESVRFAQPVRFAGADIAADVITDATYRFNSWRIGYHYLLRQSDALRLRIGATLKVRDAEIQLVQGDTVGVDDDVGLVPLFYLAGQYRLGDRWTLGADLDALAGGPGRAIDLGVTLDRALSSRWRVGAEWRLLDGGADTDEVYNFARFQTAAITLQSTF